MSAKQICPIRHVSMSIMVVSMVQASIAHPMHAEALQDKLSKDDKNCNTHNCAMWNKRRKCCGLIQGGAA